MSKKPFVSKEKLDMQRRFIYMMKRLFVKLRVV